MGAEFDECADFYGNMDLGSDFSESINGTGEIFESPEVSEYANTEEFSDDIGEDISDEGMEDAFESSEYENDATDEISEDIEEADDALDDEIAEEIPEDIEVEEQLSEDDNLEEETIYDDSDVMKENKTAMQELSSYMNEHNYGPNDFEEYSQDPEWQRLHKEAFPDWEGRLDISVAEDMEESDIAMSSDEIAEEIPEDVDDEEQVVEVDNMETDTALNNEMDGEVAQEIRDNEDLGQDLLNRFETCQHKNGSDYFVKGDNYEQFENDYYSGNGAEYTVYDTPIEKEVSPSQIEGIHLGKEEIENPSVFWRQHENGGTAESFQKIASHIPEVRERLEAGATLDDLEDDPVLADCAGIYFRNKPEVIERNGYYEFNSNGRHRIMAARSLGYDIPVKIVGKRS